MEFNPKAKFEMVSYFVNKTEVVIGRRPNIGEGISKKLFDSFDAILSVTETYLAYPVDKLTAWFPWKEIREHCPDYVLFSSLKTLNYWINELKLKKVYIHCDLGTHRAPTIFGAFLYAYYENSSLDIIEKRKIKLGKDKESYYEYKFGKLKTNPVKCFNEKNRVNPRIKYLIEIIARDEEKDLSSILDKLEKELPDELCSKEELSERIDRRKFLKETNKAKEKLKSAGFLFENNNHNEFKANYKGADVFVFILLKDRPFPKGIIHSKFWRTENIVYLYDFYGKNKILLDDKINVELVGKIANKKLYRCSLYSV